MEVLSRRAHERRTTKDGVSRSGATRTSSRSPSSPDFQIRGINPRVRRIEAEYIGCRTNRYGPAVTSGTARPECKRLPRSRELRKCFDLQPGSQDRPTGRRQDLAICADEVGFERTTKAILAVIDLHHDTNALHGEKLATVVEGKARERHSTCAIRIACPGTVRRADEHLVRAECGRCCLFKRRGARDSVLIEADQ